MRETVTIEDFSEFVYFMRKSIGFTKRAFAAAIGVTTKTLFNWEQARTLPYDLTFMLITIRNAVKEIIKINRMKLVDI